MVDVSDRKDGIAAADGSSNVSMANANAKHGTSQRGGFDKEPNGDILSSQQVGSSFPTVGSVLSDHSESNLNRMMDADESDEQSCDSVRCLFQKASEYLHPGPLFRFIVYLYGERKLLVFFFIHFVCTIVIWVHFALIKFAEQKNSVPEGAPYYWWKRLAPPLEFGSMHAILFQMALIPLTMSRFSIAALSESIMDRFVPLSRSVRIHIHLGYTMVFIIFLATIFFFIFFGINCAGGDQSFCDKFTSEIMITGYVTMGLLLIIAGTSYFRYRIPYELFYAIHHLVFIMYAVVIVHTFDRVQRSHERERSQTFKWFSATLLYYICDRAAMHINHKYRARLVSSSAVTGSNGTRMIILRLRRPALFKFKPGQYAYLQLHEIDSSWHPFSIASGPSSSLLEFYVEVYGDASWTGRLWQILEGDGDGGLSHRQIDIEVMGPIGTSLAKTDDYSHALAIGTGTGIVPILSLFKQQVRQLLRLDPKTHFRELRYHQRKILDVETAEESRKGSVVRQLSRSCKCRKEYVALDEPRVESVKGTIRSSISRREELGNGPSSREIRNTMKEMKSAAFKATRSIYGVILLACLPVFGIAMIGFTISWNTISIDLYTGMVEFLQAGTVAFQACFALVAILIWDASQFFAFIDVAVCIISPFADWFWFDRYNSNELLRPADVTLYCLLIGYMTFRAWNMVVKPRSRSWRTRADDSGVRTLEKVEVVWATRSTSLVSEIMPDIDEIWAMLVDSWGEENAASVCQISIYVTDKDRRSVDLLKKELSQSPVYQRGWVHFGRPDFPAIIEDHTIDLICTRRSSYSVLAYVGSPELAREIHHYKTSNDMVTAITGNKKHQTDFVSESYGAVKGKKKLPKQPKDSSVVQDSQGMDSPKTLTTRRITSYGGDVSQQHGSLSKF